MRRLILIAIAVVMLAAMYGCNRDDTVQESPPASVEHVDLPTEVSLPSTMKIEDMIKIVNTLIEFPDGHEFDMEHAEVWDDPDFNEVLYYFDRSDYEVVFFADDQTHTFKYGYLRLLWSDEHFLELSSITAAFLMTLEPNEYENMLTDIFDQLVDIIDSLEEPEEEYDDHWHPLYESVVSHGEVWSLAATDNVRFNIFPKDTDVFWG